MLDFTKIYLRLPIRSKLLIAFGSVSLLSVVLLAVSIRSINVILEYNRINEVVDRLGYNFVKLNAMTTEFFSSGFKSEEFQLQGESGLLVAHSVLFGEVTEDMNILSNHGFLRSAEIKKSLDTLNQYIVDYDDTFKDLLKAFKERGFQDHGVEGQLRSAIHDVEDAEFNYDRASMLMLRRHEKDFFLRKDLKYLERFNAVINEFKSAIQSSIDDGSPDFAEKKSVILRNLSHYQSKFNYIVALEQKIGLASNEGIVGNLNHKLEAAESLIARLTSSIKSETGFQTNQAIALLVGVFALQILIGFILVVVYSGMIANAVKQIRDAIVALAGGRFPERLELKTQDEISETKVALNNLVERIRSAVEFSNELGAGNLSANYDERHKDDVLAKSILSLQDQLRTTEESQKKNNWSNQGMALFNEILKDDSTSINDLADKIIETMVNYLEANQGAVYMLDEQRTSLQRIATYAYGKKKFVDQEIAVGQGLIGQCVLEKETVYLKKVPENYTKITSGLGEATPRSVLLVPLKIREEIMGVIELASFQLFSSYQIDFVEKISESIANILLSKQGVEKTNRLLDESGLMAEQMKAQEEEMRQNMEELAATQEEMQRQKMEMEKEILALREKLSKETSDISH